MQIITALFWIRNETIITTLNNDKLQYGRSINALVFPTYYFESKLQNLFANSIEK